MAGSMASSMALAIKLIVLFISIGFFALNVWFLTYVYELEKKGCKCAMGWRRQFMEFTLALIVLLTIVGLFINWPANFMWLALAYQALIIVYIFVTRGFINDMNESRCDCAHTDAFKWLNVVNIIQLVYLAIIFTILLMSVVFYAFNIPSAMPANKGRSKK